jgi:predicted RNA methylase
MIESLVDGAAVPLPIRATAIVASAVIKAARQLLIDLERGRRVDAAVLRDAMEAAFAASDTTGAWNWKTAYDACEAATVLFLRRYGAAMRAKAAPPAAMLPLLLRIASLLPTQTRRSEESQSLQQFSTPIGLAYVASIAAAITPADVVLEPSAGTGLLAILAELAGASLILNEFSESRAGILGDLFSAVSTTRFDAAHINDHLDAGIVPSVVLMNPPFSAAVHVDRQMRETALRHVGSALARLPEGGRLVTITGANVAPDNPVWTDSFKRLQEQGRVVFSAAIDGAVYAKHGTTIDTRLTVIDRVAADDIAAFPESPGIAPDLPTLLGWVMQYVPPRRPVAGTATAVVPAIASAPTPRTVRAYVSQRPPAAVAPTVDLVATEVAYELVDWAPTDASKITDALYEPYALQSIHIPGVHAHPTRLVQSAAMASVAPPKPSYRPHLPARAIADGILSDAQVESVIYAGEAHSAFLAGSWTVDATLDVVAAARDDAENAVRFRRGWFLGDGTGAGKGRQVAGILLDNWLKGRRRAVWISKSDKLIEDAQRDWSALGMERLLVTPLSRFRQGTPIRLSEGILFATYATLRTDERGEKLSRVQQIVEWLGSDPGSQTGAGFDGVIVFDESHAMQNAVGGKGERGDQAASQQGRAGLRLQHALPNARVVYVSATGATTVHNLAYAQRLGLWGGDDFPFATRAEFVEAIEDGGVAAMEVLARDLKALGLYAARSLSYEGVEYELLEHRLTPEQIRIYDAYAGAFSIIHNNLDAAMRATNITGATGTLNAQAKSAARSAFESAKQRFFGHLLTSMKTPSLIRSIERDLDAGHAAVIQIVSTGEALMERRLAEIQTEDWGDVQVDITPREYVLDYLAHSFPVQLYEPFTDSEGNLCSRPVHRDGQPVESREAIARRDRLIEKLASLPPVPGALDQIVQRFGTDMVAEVTGRSRRVIRKRDRLIEPRRLRQSRRDRRLHG